MSETPHISLLGKRHDRSAFHCEEEALNRYLREQASQDARRHLTRVYVATFGDDNTVIGFYTLSSFSVQVGELPEAIALKLPKYAVPAALIGRLAIDQQHAGKGLGSFLLVDALQRVLFASETLGIYAVFVDAKNDAAQTFYERFGFISLPSQPRRLFLPTQTAREAFVPKG